MKLRGRTDFSLKKIGIFSVALFAILSLIRVYQTFFLMEAETGFFAKKDITVPVMYLLAILGPVIISAVCYISVGANIGSGENIEKKASPLFVASGVLFGIGILFSGAKELVSTLSTLFEYIRNGAVDENGKALGLKAAAGGNIALLCILFAFIGGLVLILQSVLSLKKGSLPSFMKLPLLCPVLWAFFVTLRYFSVTKSYTKVSQLLFVIFAMAFLMVFLFEDARIYSDIGKKEAVWFFYASGIITAGLFAAANIPYILAFVFARQRILPECSIELYSVFGSVYVILSMLKRSRELTAADKTEAENVTENN